MKLKILFLTIICALCALVLTVSAQTLSKNVSEVLSAYRKYKNVDSVNVVVPTVVEVSLGNEFIERSSFAVFNQTTKAFEPYYFKTQIGKTSFSVSTSISSAGAYKMIDNNLRTYVDFPLPEENQGHVRIILTSPQEITSSGFTLLLEDHVALPNRIEVHVQTSSGENIVVGDRQMQSSTIRFLKTSAKKWIIDLTYGQPLRIIELRLIQDDSLQGAPSFIRFLAQPDNDYRIYLDPDRQTTPIVGESGNLSGDKDVLRVGSVASRNNPNYVIADIDDDGVPDVLDNCVSVANANQEDVNNNGRGDVCDDFDKDGLINSEDNCPNNPNRNQKDDDSDGIGDVCDQQESRITERYKWFPWLGVGFAIIVIVVLLVLTAKSMKNDQANS